MIIILRLPLLSQQLLLIAGCFFLFFKLYLSLRQRNVLILLIANPSFFSFSVPPSLSRIFLFFFHPSHLSLRFSNLYCLMGNTFLRLLAVPSRTDFCKVHTLYDISIFFKLHSNLFGMDPSAPQLWYY